MGIDGSAPGEVPVQIVAATDIKRRRRSKQERRRIVEETLRPGASVARVARTHGVNANQVFHWRRLYEQGLLELDSSTTRLLPVKISDVAETVCSAGASAMVEVQHRPSVRTPSSGTIHIEVGKARLRIEGEVDPRSLRVVLECLLG